MPHGIAHSSERGLSSTAHGGMGQGARVPRELRAWMITQRLQKKSGKLDAERERRLSEAGFPWAPHESQWQRQYKEVEEFKRTHGDCRVPAGWKENPQLANWVGVQRAARKGRQAAESPHGIARSSQIRMVSRPSGEPAATQRSLVP